jgi:hypothetical protein
VTPAEILSLLRDCLVLWQVDGRLAVEAEEITLTTAAGERYTIAAVEEAQRPARWRLQTPARQNAGRPPRMHPSIGALLSSLRNELGANIGNRLRVGAA